jgi:hypothetical protein
MVDAWLPTWPEKYTKEICKKTFVHSLKQGEAKIVSIEKA